MYVVINRLDVPPARAEAFEERFGGNMAGTLGAVPGLVRSSLMRPHRDGDPYLAVMEFDTEADFQGWLHSDAFAHAHGHGPGQDAGRDVESYSVVIRVEPTA